MPTPFINTTQSVLYCRQNEPFTFQPFAMYAPAEWSCSKLPDGMNLNVSHGTITGTPTKPGVYVFALIAHNEDGPSDPVVFTMGVKAGISNPTDNVIDVAVDLTTRKAVLIDLPEADPIFSAKYGDVVILRVRFRRLGAIVPLLCTSVKFAIKEIEEERTLVESNEAIHAGDLPGSESGDEGIYLLPISFDSNALKSALGNYVGDRSTGFNGLAEIEWVAENSLGGEDAPVQLRGSSRTFNVEIIRDLIA